MIDNTFLSLVTWLFYCLSCLGIGLFVWSCFKLNNLVTLKQSSTIILITQFLLGISLLNAILVIAGLWGKINLPVIIPILLFGLLALFANRKDFLHSVQLITSQIASWKNEANWLKLLTIFNFIIVCLFAIATWTFPPIGDAEAFYLVYPKIIASTGWIEPMHGSYFSFSSIGLSAELHYAILMMLADAGAAKLFIFPISIAAIATLAEITKLCGGSRIATVLTWTILLSSTAFNHSIFDGKVDLFAASFGLMAVYWSITATKFKIQTPYYILTGLFAGLASVYKFSYLPSLGTTLLVLVIWHQLMGRSHYSEKQNTFIKLSFTLLLIGLFATIGWIPQLIKNYVLFDAPFAPFIGSTENSGWLNQVWFSPDITKHILLTYPLALVFGRYPMQSGGLSFLIIAFMPFLLLLPKPKSWKNSLLTSVTLSGLAAMIVWMILMPSIIAPRYILCSLLLLTPVIAITSEYTLSKIETLSISKIAVLITATFGLIASTWHISPISTLLISKIKNKENNCLLASGYCEAIKTINLEAEPHDRIFVAGYYSFWLNANQLQCRDSNLEYDQIEKERDIISWLSRRGFKYIIVDSESHQWINHKIQESNILDYKLIYQTPSNPINVYRITLSSQPITTCNKSSNSRWRISEQ